MKSGLSFPTSTSDPLPDLKARQHMFKVRANKRRNRTRANKPQRETRDQWWDLRESREVRDGGPGGMWQRWQTRTLEIPTHKPQPQKPRSRSETLYVCFFFWFTKQPSENPPCLFLLLGSLRTSLCSTVNVLLEGRWGFNFSNLEFGWRWGLWFWAFIRVEERCGWKRDEGEGENADKGWRLKKHVERRWTVRMKIRIVCFN